MSNVSNWSNTATGNNTAAPDGFPEGMLPSGVNDAAREVMAAIRRWYESAEWIDLGLAHTRTGASTLTINGDYTATYTVGRRVKMTGSATAYGTISASSYVAPDTTVTISESNVPATLATVSVGILSGSNSAMPSRVPGLFTVTAPSSGQTLSTSIVAGSSGGNIVTDGTVTGYTRTTAATSLNFGTNSAHALNLVTNDTTRASVSSAGNVTINAPSSGNALTVNGLIAIDTGAITQSIQEDGSGALLDISGSNNWRIYTGGSERIRVGNTGNVTINAPSSGNALTSNGTSVITNNAGSSYTMAFDGSGFYSDCTGAFASYRIYTNNALRATINSAGNWAISAPSSGYTLSVDGETNARGVALTAYKTATTTRTTATPSNDPHLVIAIPAAGTYAVEVFVRLNPDGPGGAGGFLWGLNYSGSYTAIESYISSNGMINAAAQIEGTSQIGSSAATGIWFRTAILSGDWVQLRGTLTATSSGNLGFNWSQNSAAGNLTLTAGAYMKATKLS